MGLFLLRLAITISYLERHLLYPPYPSYTLCLAKLPVYLNLGNWRKLELLDYSRWNSSNGHEPLNHPNIFRQQFLQHQLTAASGTRNRLPKSAHNPLPVPYGVIQVLLVYICRVRVHLSKCFISTPCWTHLSLRELSRFALSSSQASTLQGGICLLCSSFRLLSAI